MLALLFFACTTVNDGVKGPPPPEAPRPQPQAPQAPVTTTISFVPPRGPLAGSPEQGPGRLRLLGAVSKDGLTFTPTNEVITDQAGAPDLVADTAGNLYLYYTAGKIGSRSDALGVAVSSDRGRTWIHRLGVVNGESAPPVDPDVVILPDGTFRLYYTAPRGGAPAISYAESRDGLIFTAKGPVFAPPGGAMDSNVYRSAKGWHMYAFNQRAEPVWYASSRDGTHFEAEGRSGTIAERVFASNAVRTPNGLRMFSFDLHNDICAWSSKDGLDWKREAKAVFRRGNRALEGAYVKDATAAILPDGSWFAVYVTPIPR